MSLLYPFPIESLESRRLLSAATLTTSFLPIAGTDVGVSFLSGGGSGNVQRQGPVNGSFEGFPDFTGWQTAGNDLVLARDFHAVPDGAAQAVLSTGSIPNNG